MFDFGAQEPGELEFKRNDIISLISKEDPHWWKGEIGSRSGLFPASYVSAFRS